MNLDLDLIKEILKKIRNECDGFNTFCIEGKYETGTENEWKNHVTLAYHYKILFDNYFAEGKVQELCCGETIPQYIYYKALTLEGHKLLDSMLNDTLWNKIKSKLIKPLGIESLKQIPGLAIGVLT